MSTSVFGTNSLIALTAKAVHQLIDRTDWPTKTKLKKQKQKTLWTDDVNCY